MTAQFATVGDLDELDGRFRLADADTRRVMTSCVNQLAELGASVRRIDARTEAMGHLVARMEFKLDDVTARESTAVRERAALLSRVQGYQAEMRRADAARAFWSRWWAKLFLVVVGGGGAELVRALVAHLF